MTWCDCTSVESGSKISLSDARSKRKAIFLNEAKLRLEKTQWDKCVVCGATAADWILTCKRDGQVIVELKGRHVEHGCDQILQSAEELKNSGKLGSKVAGLIVCTQYPSFDSKVRRAKKEFYAKYSGPLHVVTKSREFELAKVVRMNGPG